jgi:hypothetical protein
MTINLTQIRSDFDNGIIVSKQTLLALVDYAIELEGKPITRQEYCSERPARFVVCAANKYGDLVFTGVRHFCPVMQVNMQAYDIPALRKERGEVQGFIDQFGVFMTREEAAIVAKESGQLARYGNHCPTVLFSEDLY